MPLMKRRTFIQTSLATSVVASLPLRAFGAIHQLNKVGLQLYTVRDAMKADMAGTLAKVAAVGYKEVEFAGYMNQSPKDIRAYLVKDGLSAPSAHFPADTFANKLPETLEAAHIIGHKFLVCPWTEEAIRKQPDGYKHVAEAFNKYGEACAKAGIQFAYHNHVFEFEPYPSLGGKTPYDYLLENTDAKMVKMEMDLGWATVAGQDPLTYFKRYPGRFPLVHVKDMKVVPHPAPSEIAAINMEEIGKTTMTDAGSGAIDWKRIFADSEQAGIQHYYVEFDNPPDPFASIAKSYTYLAALRF
jgi:sugar phosphate isomerase/epimerase